MKLKSFKKELAQWGVIAAIVGFLYLTGWHTEVTGRLQQVILWTGIIQADTNLPESKRVQVDYDMPLQKLDGSHTGLNEFKGKVIFLNFWATWCPPCIAEMPTIQKLYEEYGGRDEVAFVMVSLDKDPDKAARFIENREFTFPVYHLNGRRPPVFQSDLIPTTYVIDKEGRLVIQEEGMANYNTSKFRSFLSTLINN